jgi:universal stress protein E
MKTELRKIVVGTSLDLASDRVVRAALLLKEKTGADLYLVHGYPMPVAYGGGLYPVPTLDLDDLANRSRVTGQLARLGAKPEDFAEIAVMVGFGDQLLLDVADRIGADLIAVGASETSPGLQAFFGSTADRLLRRTTRPVLVVRGELELPGQVLATTDLSDLSQAALARGIGLIDRFAPQAKVEALFVLSRLDREGSAHFQPQQIDRFAMEELEAFLGRLPKRPAGELFPALRSGDPREEVLAHLAAHDDIDLVLLGTHGRRGFQRFLLGSVASELMRRLKVSALVVPPENQGEA